MTKNERRPVRVLPWDEIEVLARKGVPYYEIAKQYDVAISQITRAMVPRGIRRIPEYKMSGFRLDHTKVIELVNDGLDTERIANILGTTRYRIGKLLTSMRAKGLIPRSSRLLKGVDWDVIEAKARDGESYARLSRDYSISHSHISKKMHERGLPKRKKTRQWVEISDSQ